MILGFRHGKKTTNRTSHDQARFLHSDLEASRPPARRGSSRNQSGLRVQTTRRLPSRLRASQGPSFELEDLSVNYQRSTGRIAVPASWEAKRAEKRLHKLEVLAAREEMKFSHSIQFNAVPDWSNNYISYSNLKKLYVDIALTLERQL
jgi:hypothetical protein